MSESSDARPGPNRFLRATAMVATGGVVLALVGLILLARPVTTPVQDCGTIIGFLLDGRTNQFADPEDPPTNLSAEEVTDNNERPCRDRVADAARWGVLAFAVGLAVASVALTVELTNRAWWWFTRWQSARRSPPPDREADERPGVDVGPPR